MSRPLSILATIFLLIVPSLLSDRCAGGEPAAPGSSVTADAPTAVRSEALDREGPSPRSDPRRPVWAGPVKWVFVAQRVAISVIDRVILDRTGDTR
jgi:hypothetical protein